MTHHCKRRQGFTLVELSIVLVIIGLIIGGVLVGQDLIAAATVRAQIAQIEKYQAATNTFKSKYHNQLPGDISEPDATSYGFQTRGTSPGQGDGNGLIEGTASLLGSSGTYWHGEPAMFWRDLSDAQLLDGSFTTETPTDETAAVQGTMVDLYLPKSKISGGHVSVWSGGWQIGTGKSDYHNYFAITNPVILPLTGVPQNMPAMTVAQAYAIDSKVDDGLPQTGRVLALNNNTFFMWSTGAPLLSNYLIGSGDYDAATDGPITASSASPYYSTDHGTALNQTCYNNGHTLQPEHYSLDQNNGMGVNCVVSIQFQ